MKAGRKREKVIYCKRGKTRFLEGITRNWIISALFIASLTVSIFGASAEPAVITRTITVRMTILPEAELKIDEAKIDKSDVWLNSKEFLNALFPENENLKVDKISRDGVEMIRLTKICQEYL